MKYENFTMQKHGFVGHLVEPDNGADRAVIVIMGGIENLIMVSPTHVPFEGTLKDKKTMTGHSVATWQGKDIPFVKADFSAVKAGKYQKHPNALHKVTGMWGAYYNAYQDKEAERNAWLQIEKTNARILLIAGDCDEAWPAEYSVRALERYLKENLAYFEQTEKEVIDWICS